MAQHLFYQEPMALDRLEHRHLCLKRKDDLEFARAVNSVPIAGSEFFEASRDFPILFMQNPQTGNFTPVVILALREKGHVFGNNWGNLYMPAFIRRYPFALSKDGAIMVDRQAPHLQEDDGERLFNDAGENTEALDSIIGFLRESDNQFMLTRQFSDALAKQDLLIQFDTKVQVDDNTVVDLGDVFIVDEKKLKELPDDIVTQWFRQGWLAWCYAHLHSTGAIPRLAQREYEASQASNQ